MQRRTDNASRHFYRSDRYFRQNGQWYFATREGEYGPYATHAAAEHALDLYLAERSQLARFQKLREREARLEQVRAHARHLAEKEAAARQAQAKRAALERHTRYLRSRLSAEVRKPAANDSLPTNQLAAGDLPPARRYQRQAGAQSHDLLERSDLSDLLT